MGVLSTTDFHGGAKIEVGGEPYLIVEFQHVKPGKGGAFVRTRLKHLKTGRVIDKTFRAGERFPEPDVEVKEAQCLYIQGDEVVFMELQTYEQFTLTSEQLGESRLFLKEPTVATILFYQGVPISVTLPTFLNLTVAHTDPGHKGNTATGVTKPAVLETGATVKVPLHVKEGDVVRVDTRTGMYVERAS